MTTTKKFNDPNLSEEEQEAIVGAFVRKREDAKLRDRWTQKLAKEHDVLRKAPPVKAKAIVRRLPILLLSAAAAILLLLVFLPGLMTESGDELLADKLTEIKLSASRAAVGPAERTSLEVLRQQLRDNFLAGNFTAAISQGEQLIALAEATDNDRLDLGLAYLQAERFAEAQTAFKGLLSGDSDFASEARFYLGLSLLSAGDTAAGLEELRRITAADGSRLLESAKELLEADWD